MANTKVLEFKRRINNILDSIEGKANDGKWKQAQQLYLPLSAVVELLNEELITNAELADAR